MCINVAGDGVLVTWRSNSLQKSITSDILEMLTWYTLRCNLEAGTFNDDTSMIV